MSDAERIDLTHLFKIALDWYEQHPGEFIPDELWDEQANEFEDGVCWVANVGDVSITGEFIEIIPFIAAIALGHSHPILLQVLNQFDVSPFDIRKTEIKQLDTPATDSVFQGRIKKPITSWAVCRDLVQAISLDETLADNFFVRIGLEDNPLEAARLLSPLKEFWPATEINDDLEDPSRFRMGMHCATAIDVFLHNSVDLSELSDEIVLEMLDRSGNLTLGKEIENGMPSEFFLYLFTSDTSWELGNAKKLLSALNSVKEPVMVDKIAQKIISDLSSQNLGIGEGEGLMIIKGLYHCLDPVVYSKVFDSITMKVNLTSFSNVCLFDAINESNFPMEALKDILDPKDLLSKLSAELIALAPDQYRSQHFKALRRIASDEFPSVRFDALDLNPLLLAAIKGLDAYRATTHTNPSGTVITTFKDTAEQDVKQLLRAALPHMKIDYSSFTSLTSDSKVFMAANGFEVKRIKGATRHDRGRMLDDQLGL